MNILILEPKSTDSQGIDASSLRLWLSQMGWKKVDLCSTLSELKARLAKGGANHRLVLVNDPGEQLPEFSDSVGIPVIWLDSARKKRNALNGHFSLRKVFGPKALRSAIVESSKFFLSRKTDLVYLGSNPSHALLEIMDAKVSSWGRMIVVNQASKLDKYVNPDKFSQVGAILVEPSFAEAAGTKWIRAIQSKPAFIHLPWACLSVDPDEVGASKTNCEYFFHEQGEEESLSEWNDRLDLLWMNHIHRVESDLLIQVGKEHVRKEELSQAKNCFESLRKLLRNRSDMLCYLGDIYARQGKAKKSEICYRQSVMSNPFNPHAYVKLLNQLETSFSPDFARWAAVAALTCEKHPQIIEILKRLYGGTVYSFPDLKNQIATPVAAAGGMEGPLLRTGTK